jgi:hypothetical protein
VIVPDFFPGCTERLEASYRNLFQTDPQPIVSERLTYNFLSIDLAAESLPPNTDCGGVLVSDWLNLSIRWLMRWHNGARPHLSVRGGFLQCPSLLVRQTTGRNSPLFRKLMYSSTVSVTGGCLVTAVPQFNLPDRRHRYIQSLGRPTRRFTNYCQQQIVMKSHEVRS